MEKYSTVQAMKWNRPLRLTALSVEFGCKGSGQRINVTFPREIHWIAGFVLAKDAIWIVLLCGIVLDINAKGTKPRIIIVLFLPDTGDPPFNFPPARPPRSPVTSNPPGPPGTPPIAPNDLGSLFLDFACNVLCATIAEGGLADAGLAHCISAVKNCIVF